MPDLSLENKYLGKIVCGVDEVGRGCLAGDVYACAVILPNNFSEISQLKDSKKLTAKKRDYLAKKIKEEAKFSIGIATVEEIYKINILNAAMLAMERAIKGLKECPEICLIDGNKSPNLNNVVIETVIRGDNISCSIAAASILAKVERDKKMTELSQEHPVYLWNKNAGYGTKIHIENIEKHGITKWHRKSFAPIKKYLEEKNND